MNIGVNGNVELRIYSNLGVLKSINHINNTITYNLAQGVINKILYPTSSHNITPRYILRSSTTGDYLISNSEDYKDRIKCTEFNDTGEVYNESEVEIGRSSSFRFIIPSQSWLVEDIASMAIMSSSGEILAIINLESPITKSSDNYFDIRWNLSVVKGGES